MCLRLLKKGLLDMRHRTMLTWLATWWRPKIEWTNTNSSTLNHTQSVYWIYCIYQSVFTVAVLACWACTGVADPSLMRSVPPFQFECLSYVLICSVQELSCLVKRSRSERELASLLCQNFWRPCQMCRWSSPTLSFSEESTVQYRSYM